MLYLVLSAALLETIVAAFLAIKSNNASSKKRKFASYLLPVALGILGIIVFVIGLGIFMWATFGNCTGFFDCSNVNNSAYALLPSLQLNSILMYLGPYMILAALYWFALVTKHKLRSVLIVAVAVFTAFILIYNNIWHT